MRNNAQAAGNIAFTYQEKKKVGKKNSKHQPLMENIPALLIRTCKGPIRAFHASANLETDSKDKRSSSITFKNHHNINLRKSKHV
jgi:hypothetical protein